MWLTPKLSRSAMVASARAWLIPPKAAAPKMTRLESCPVRPNGCVGSILEEYLHSEVPVSQDTFQDLARARLRQGFGGDLDRLGHFEAGDQATAMSPQLVTGGRHPGMW